MIKGGPVVSRHSYVECNRCGKHNPVGLGHACHPYMKYDRSKKLWVDKTEEEYSKVELNNDKEYQGTFKVVIDNWDEDGFAPNVDGKETEVFKEKPTYLEFRKVMSNNGGHLVEDDE